MKVIHRMGPHSLAQDLQGTLPSNTVRADWIAHLVAARSQANERVEQIQRGLLPSIARIDDPAAIPDMDKAIDRICSAIEQGEHIAIACDHDADGTTSAAVFFRALHEHFGVDERAITIHTSHRVNEGYGLSDAVVQRIKATKATLVITGDKGSSDQPRIHDLASHQIDVVVTDHHLVPNEGPPSSALACVNPARQDSTYDSTIAGVAVAWLTMAKVRTALIQRGHLPHDVPSLSSLLDVVAVGVVADCVSLHPRSSNNRAFVRAGLQLINTPGHRAVWDVARHHIDGPVTEQTIAFSIAPMLAAGGRLDWSTQGIELLTTNNRLRAQNLWAELDQLNQQRKDIQKTMQATAERVIEGDHQAFAHVIYLPEGHSGIHGIVASRISEMTGKPTVMLSPKGGRCKNQGPVSAPPDMPLLSGSLRAGMHPAIHLRDALQTVNDAHPNLLKAFGGHQAAAGITIAQSDWEAFARAFDHAIAEQTHHSAIEPVYATDGAIPHDITCPQVVAALEQFAPWGRGFERPLFLHQCRVLDVRAMGDGTHLRYRLERKDTGETLQGVWFGALKPGAQPSIVRGVDAWFLFELAANYFRGRVSIQAIIRAADRQAHPENTAVDAAFPR